MIKKLKRELFKKNMVNLIIVAENTPIITESFTPDVVNDVDNGIEIIYGNNILNLVDYEKIEYDNTEGQYNITLKSGLIMIIWF